MIECIFTIDYEIYGNGEGSLRDLVFEPAEKLRTIFREAGYRFVAFVEAAELELIEAEGTDPAIDMVRDQIQTLYGEEFELGLHLHPQWYNAKYENGKWLLDYNEYNLCKLPRKRIVEIVDRSIEYLRNILSQPSFSPLSFRAGNWLFQPTQTAASVLAEKGIRVDSSVFKGGLQHRHGLDYRRAIGNDYYWSFSDHVDIPDSNGNLLEIPTFTQMVPFWKMLTVKRLGMQQKGSSSKRVSNNRIHRFLDFLRLQYPLKLDYCRMTFDELTAMLDVVVREDQKYPAQFRPIVAIGHTKDLIDYKTVKSFLSYVDRKGITVSTFKDVYSKCKR